jgi:hypothetical protein
VCEVRGTQGGRTRAGEGEGLCRAGKISIKVVSHLPPHRGHLAEISGTILLDITREPKLGKVT